MFLTVIRAFRNLFLYRFLHSFFSTLIHDGDYTIGNKPFSSHQCAEAEGQARCFRIRLYSARVNSGVGAARQARPTRSCK